MLEVLITKETPSVLSCYFNSKSVYVIPHTSHNHHRHHQVCVYMYIKEKRVIKLKNMFWQIRKMYKRRTCSTCPSHSPYSYISQKNSRIYVQVNKLHISSQGYVMSIAALPKTLHVLIPITYQFTDSLFLFHSTCSISEVRSEFSCIKKVLES
jgi:hypothetical protein